ncbi:MAG: outer membrane beta-barrel protein [Chitinophagaceae bacterium]|nr:outer membrane beta-barrel protein [Chitinophagaceae bacterium]
MKKLILLLALAMVCINLWAQDEQKKTESNKDTIRVGGIIIVKKGKNNKDGDLQVNLGGNRHRKNKKVSTNWWIIDLGFSNYNDQTNYANAGNYLVNRPGYPALDKNDFKLRTGKSINVNLWVFMQRVSLVKNYVNLKYGLGVELNNYRYKSDIHYREDGLVPYTANAQTNAPFIFRDSVSFSKNKLAADYVTVPVMLNFVSNPGGHKKGVSLSMGVSAGYLYSQRNKQKSDERGKQKNKGDYDLERLKFSYVAELGVGPVLLYGSYSPKSMYERSLDIRPFNVGFRFSYW